MCVCMSVCKANIRFLCEGQRGDEPGQHHGGGALDVVVEASRAVSVALQQAEGIRIAEVLELTTHHTTPHHITSRHTYSTYSTYIGQLSYINF